MDFYIVFVKNRKKLDKYIPEEAKKRQILMMLMSQGNLPGRRQGDIMADQFTGMSPYLDSLQGQPQQISPIENQEDEETKLKKQKAELYKQAAGLAMAGGKSELGNGLLRMADHIYKDPSATNNSDMNLYHKQLVLPLY